MSTATEMPGNSPAAGPAPRTSALRGLRITFGGLLYCAIVLLVGLAGLNSEANLLYLLTGINFGIILVSIALPLVIVRGVEVDRLLSDAVVAGRPFQITYLVRNRRRFWNAWGLIISERAPDARKGADARRRPRFPEAFTALLAPGEQRRIEAMCLCPSRGWLSMPAVRILTRFPLGLFSCHVDVGLPMEVMIYPPIGRFRHDPWRDYRAAAAASNRTIRNRSGHDEFYGVREYRQGDNLRWIHWRASARTGELVIREMLPLKPTQLIVLADPWPDNRHAAALAGESLRPDARAEVVISAAATALCDALERGYRAGLVCRAARPIVLPPTAGRAQRQRILHELACAAPGAAEALDEIVAQIRWSAGWHARCLLCSAGLSEPHERVVRFLGARAEALAILSPDKDDFFQLFESQDASTDQPGDVSVRRDGGRAA